MRIQDPSQHLDEQVFQEATRIQTGVYDQGTLLWKDSNAYVRRPGDQRWVPMKQTGQWTVEGGCSVYLSGGDVRKKT